MSTIIVFVMILLFVAIIAIINPIIEKKRKGDCSDGGANFIFVDSNNDSSSDFGGDCGGDGGGCD